MYLVGDREGRAEDVVGVAIDRVAAGAYRADAVVRYGDRTWLRRHWVVIESSGNSLLPWRILRTEAPRVRGS